MMYSLTMTFQLASFLNTPIKTRARPGLLASLLIATLWVATPLARAQNGVPSAAAVNDALTTLAGDLDRDLTRSQRFREYLGVAELEQALSTSSLTPQQAENFMRQLQTLQILPSRWQLERTVSAMQRNLDGGEVDDAVRRFPNCRHHLETLGPRGAGWSEILAVDELQSQLGQAPDGEQQAAQQAREAIRASVGVLERELQNLAANSDGGRTKLRQALAEWKAGSEYAVTDPLAVAARNAKFQFQAVRPEQLEAARLSLTQSMQKLESFLSQGSPENADRWKQFLRWDSLQRQVGSASPRLRELARTYQRLRSGEEGLELAPFRDVRNDLRNYLERMQLFDGAPLRRADAQRELRSAMDGLQRFLETAPQEREDKWKRFLRWDELEDVARSGCA